MKKIIHIYKDPDNEIVISKDHYHGVVVQVIRIVDQLQNTNEGLVSVRRNNVVKTIDVKLSPTFKDEVSKAIEEAKKTIASIKEADERINGLLNDYLSSHKDLNEPEQLG